MTIRHALSLGPRVQLFFPDDEGRARQEMSEECDINNIMAKYQRTGAIDHFSRHSGSYDFATGESFHEAANIVLKAQAMFDDLPSKVRSRFGGDPAAFLEFVQDDSNAVEMDSLGLMRDGFEPPVVEPVVAPVAPGGSDAPPAPDPDPPIG